MKRTIQLLILFFLFCNVISAQTNAPRSDNQLWNELQVNVPLNEKFDLVLFTSLRLGRDVTHFVDERGSVGISFKVNKYLSLMPGYLYIAAQPSKGRKSFEHRAQFTATVRVPIDKFTFSNRSIYEYRFRNSRSDSSHYRSRVQIERSIKIGSRTFTPYVADEFWYDFRIKDWNRNRFFVGVMKRLNKNLVADFFYMRQSDKRATPGDLNVFRIGLRVNF
jgi:hypothetical protein